MSLIVRWCIINVLLRTLTSASSVCVKARVTQLFVSACLGMSLYSTLPFSRFPSPGGVLLIVRRWQFTSQRVLGWQLGTRPAECAAMKYYSWLFHVQTCLLFLKYALNSNELKWPRVWANPNLIPLSIKQLLIFPGDYCSGNEFWIRSAKGNWTHNSRLGSGIT